MGILWTQPSPEWHLSTQRGLFVDTTFPKIAFVHAEGAWCGCNVLSGRLGRKVTDGKGAVGREPWEGSHGKGAMGRKRVRWER